MKPQTQNNQSKRTGNKPVRQQPRDAVDLRTMERKIERHYAKLLTTNVHLFSHDLDIIPSPIECQLIGLRFFLLDKKVQISASVKDMYQMVAWLIEEASRKVTPEEQKRLLTYALYAAEFTDFAADMNLNQVLYHPR